MADNPVKYDCLVAEALDGRRVVLNKGTQDGISQGDKFLVFSLGGEVHDPKTGESLGVLEKIKGKGKVIHVQEHLCTIETYEFDMMPAPSLFFRQEPFYRNFVDVQRGDYARKLGFWTS